MSVQPGNGPAGGAGVPSAGPAEPERLPTYDRLNARQRQQIRSGQVDPFESKMYRRSKTGNYEIQNDPNRSVNQTIKDDVREGALDFDARQKRVLDQAQAYDFEGTQGSIVSAWNNERSRQEEEYAQVYAQAQQMGGTPFKTSKGWSIKILESAGTGEVRTRIVNAAVAMTKQGLDYSWGGGGAKGPSYGINDGIGPASRNVYGFDCSGLVQYAYAKAGISLGRHSTAQTTSGRIVPTGQLKPGDIVGWGRTPQTSTHVAIYIGNGYVAEAANTRDDLQIRKLGSWPMDKQAFGVQVLRGI